MAKKKIATSRDWHDKGYWAHGKNKYRLEVIPIKELWASVPIAKVHNGVQRKRKELARIKSQTICNMGWLKSGKGL